ncbi:MAG: hypothetical protein R2712_04370 [Vicinamibacterales bacterium]
MGPLRLVRARGDEPFDTVGAGSVWWNVRDPREVVWADDLGVTLARWNWRAEDSHASNPTRWTRCSCWSAAPMSSTRCTLPAMRWSQRSGAVPGGARRHATPPEPA